MSHKATTFSLARPSKCASPRPQVPIRATFNLLLGASAPNNLVLGRMSPAAPVKAIDFRKWRRFISAVCLRTCAEVKYQAFPPFLARRPIGQGGLCQSYECLQ